MVPGSSKQSLTSPNWEVLQVVLSAVMGNFLVGLAAFFAISSRTIISKIFSVAVPVLTFAALGIILVTLTLTHTKERDV